MGRLFGEDDFSVLACSVEWGMGVLHGDPR